MSTAGFWLADDADDCCNCVYNQCIGAACPGTYSSNWSNLSGTVTTTIQDFWWTPTFFPSTPYVADGELWVGSLTALNVQRPSPFDMTIHRRHRVEWSAKVASSAAGSSGFEGHQVNPPWDDQVQYGWFFNGVTWNREIRWIVGGVSGSVAAAGTASFIQEIEIGDIIAFTTNGSGCTQTHESIRRLYIDNVLAEEAEINIGFIVPTSGPNAGHYVRDAQRPCSYSVSVRQFWRTNNWPSSFAITAMASVTT